MTEEELTDVFRGIRDEIGKYARTLLNEVLE